MLSKKIILYLVLVITYSMTSIAQDEIQVAFDSNNRIFTIVKDSELGSTWIEIGDFVKINLFETSDSVFFLEVYTQATQGLKRSRKSVTKEVVYEKRKLVDNLILVQSNINTTKENQGDLKFDFNLNHVGLIAGFHAWAIPEALEMNYAFYYLITGGSYFAVTAIADRTFLTRESVEISGSGHSTGIIQGLLSGFVLDSWKASLLLGSAAGFGHAFYSFEYANNKNFSPANKQLTTSVEQYSMLWTYLGFTSALNSRQLPDARIVAASVVGVSLSSYYWAPTIFNFENRKMTFADASMVDLFHTNSVLTGLSVLIIIEAESPQLISVAVLGSSFAGLYGGLLTNESKNFTYQSVKLTKRLVYGGAALGLGTAILIDGSENLYPALITSGAWLGYFFGRSIKVLNDNYSDIDFELYPENYLTAKSINQKQLNSIVQTPIAKFTVRF